MTCARGNLRPHRIAVQHDGARVDPVPSDQLIADEDIERNLAEAPPNFSIWA
jgi:hypothetical protein